METLLVKDTDYDYHSIVKVAQASGNLGNISIHRVQDGYLVSFPEGDQDAPGLFQHRLDNLTKNIWKI